MSELSILEEILKKYEESHPKINNEIDLLGLIYWDLSPDFILNTPNIQPLDPEVLEKSMEKIILTRNQNLYADMPELIAVEAEYKNDVEICLAIEI